MADDPVIKIYGIGKVTSDALRMHHITTVGQLAALAPGELSIANLATLIHRAQEYLQSRKKEPALAESDKLVVLGGSAAVAEAVAPPAPLPLSKPRGLFAATVTTAAPPLAAAVASTPTPAPAAATAPPPATAATDRDTFMIADHTWFETRVVVPSEDSLREAIVYELGVEPSERIAFVCTWVSAPPVGQAEQLHTMTFSPQLLLHFNLDLPPLRVSMREEDFAALPNHHSLTNVLWEVELMQRRRPAAL